MRDAIAAALLWSGVALELLACLGVALMRDALDRLHYSGVSVLAAACVAAAVLVRESASLIGLKAILTAALIAAASPVLVHATARAIHLRRQEEQG